MASNSRALPPRLDGNGPTLATLHMVERLLRRTDVPLSLNKIKRRLPRKVAHRALRTAIEHYKRLGCVVEGSKGVMWVLQDDPEFWKTVDSWERW
jgi:hypothetical protein